MKKTILSFVTVLLIIFYYGCSNNAAGSSPTGPNGGGIGGIGSGAGGGANGTGGNGTVTFQIRSEAIQNGITEFDVQPSSSCTITEVDVAETTGTNFTDTIQDNGTTVYQAGTWYQLSQYTGVQSGLKFTFKFIGHTSPGGQSFTVTSNYTVP